MKKFVKKINLMNKTFINKFIILIRIKSNYGFELDLNDILELKTILDLYIWY